VIHASFGEARRSAFGAKAARAGASCGFAGLAAGDSGAFGAGGTATASPAAPITATTLLTGTVSPALTRISATTPAAGEGISASTLSVEISNSGSSRST